MTGLSTLSVGLALLLVGPRERPAVPLDAKAAILDAFREHRLVGIGDAHGDRQGGAFQLSLITDPRFSAIVNDIVVEVGNSRHQDVADRFVVRGEEVAPEALRRSWLDTTQPQAAWLQVPELFTTVRRLNASLPREQRLRILLGEPPIDWERIKTADELRTWEADPRFDRDAFAVDLIRREVLARNRRALVLYGSAHLFRRVVHQSLVTLLEGGETNARVKMFTVWTNAAAEMAVMQADVAKWPVPSLTMVRGTTLGQVGIADYFGPNGGEIPPQWRAPMEDQFDAVLYLGPLASIELARPPAWPCAEPAFPERLRRIGLRWPALAERIKQGCVR